MSAAIEVLLGVAGSGKTARLLERYRSALDEAQREGRAGTTLWLAPSGRARRAVLERLCDGSLPVVFSPNVMTFQDFAGHVLRAAPQSVTPLTPAMQRTLLRRIVERLCKRRELEHFARVAGTSGFLDLVTAFISELKCSETWPEKFTEACTRRGLRPADRELAEIYSEYQAALSKNAVYDSEGQFWSAREALQAAHWGPFGTLSLVVVDGFTDFTHTQHDILALLAERVGRLLVSLPGEWPATRADLFAKSQTVLDGLKSAGRITITHSEPGVETAAEPPPAMRHIARALFSNPRATPRAASAEGVEVVAVAGQQGEVNWIAARIKELLLTGTPPEEIVVAFRGLTDYRDLIEEGFRAAGIPFVCDAGIALDRTPLCRALVQLLKLEVEGWPFRRLLAVLDSNFFQPAWPEADEGRAVRDAAEILRHFQLRDGRERIISRLERACRECETPATGPSDEGLLDRSVIERALRLLRRLAAATAGLRKPHDLAGWAGTLGGVLSDLGFTTEPPRTAEAADPPAPTARRIRDRLEAVLFDASRAETGFGDEAPQRTLPEFIGELTDLLERELAPGALLESGRVRILPAEQVRNLDVPCLFLAGLTERSFPRREADDCLYSEAQRRELNHEGLSLAHRALRAQEEMLMFYGVVTRARRRLVLTYPVVTADGEPLSASPYLVALCELFDEGALDPRLEEQLDPVPPPERVLSSADARVRGMFDALANRPGLLRAAGERSESAATIRNLLSAVDMQVARFETPGFTNYEGMLENPENLAWVGRRFALEHELSATQLEAYAACPFEFFVSQVLEIEPLASVDVETEYGRRGTLVHEILAELHRRLFEGAGMATPGETAAHPAAGAEIVDRFHRLLRDKLGARPEQSDLQGALLEIERQLLDEWGMAYGAQWDEYVAGHSGDTGGALVPTHFETAFGKSGAGPGKTGALAPLVIGSGQREVRIGGRIDRIDVGSAEGKTVFTVIDYKTGRTRFDKLEDIASGHALQLALYTLAVVRLGLAGPETTPLRMGYWHIREQGFTPGIRPAKRGAGAFESLAAAVWETLVKTLEEVVPRLALGMRAGKFPVENADPNCTGRCPYRTVCRVGQIRAVAERLGKSWSA